MASFPSALHCPLHWVRGDGLWADACCLLQAVHGLLPRSPPVSKCSPLLQVLASGGLLHLMPWASKCG